MSGWQAIGIAAIIAVPMLVGWFLLVRWAGRR